MSPQKRLQHLRNKNKLLLDKLESHSSQIEVALKSLKKTLRVKGGADRSSSCIESKCKTWMKRNNSRQVTEALSHSKNGNDSMRYKFHFSTDVRSGDSIEVDREGINNGTTDHTENPRSLSNCSYVERRSGAVSPNSRLRSTHPRPSDVPSKDSKSLREIVSLIDYSPKSTFIRRMKHIYQPYTTDVTVRRDFGTSNDEAEERNKVHSGHSNRKKKKKKTPARGQGASQKLNAEISNVLHKMDEHHLESSRSSLCFECGKKIKKCPLTCRCANTSSNSEESGKCTMLSQQKDELERIKKFRESNWQDCHAANDSCHCCEHHRSNEIYGIDDRLFAVPLDFESENLVKCPSCLHVKCTPSCCAGPKQVIVTIPTSLLDKCDLDVDGERVKSKGNVGTTPISKELMKKLQRRPKPQNSMALRYQKGVY